MDQALNPYSPGAGIRPAALVGRSTELTLIDTMISRTARGLHNRGIILHGLRGVGKTVLLNEIARKAEAADWLTVRIEATSDKKNNKHVRTRLARELTQSARKISVRKRWKHILDILPVISAFSTTLGFTGVSFNADIKTQTGRGDSGVLELDLEELVLDVSAAAHKDGKKAFESLIQVSKETDLGDWHVRCKLVKKYQCNIYRVIENITSNICDQRNGEDVMVLTTVHRSKGLEYDLVKLADDFDLRYLLTENNIKKFKERKEAKQKETGHHLEWRQPKRIEDRENLHLLYVGATRAKEVLFLPDELVEHVQNWNVCKGNQPLSHLPSFHKTLDLM